MAIRDVMRSGLSGAYTVSRCAFSRCELLFLSISPVWFGINLFSVTRFIQLAHHLKQSRPVKRELFRSMVSHLPCDIRTSFKRNEMKNQGHFIGEHCIRFSLGENLQLRDKTIFSCAPVDPCLGTTLLN